MLTVQVCRACTDISLYAACVPLITFSVEKRLSLATCATAMRILFQSLHDKKQFGLCRTVFAFSYFFVFICPFVFLYARR